MTSLKGNFILITLAFLSFFCSIISGQNNTDSLLQSLSLKTGLERYETLTKLIDNYLFTDADKAVQYSEEALRIATEFRDESKIAFSHRDLGYGEYRRNHNTAAIKEFNTAEEMYVKLKDSLSITNIKDLKAIVYMTMKRYDIALDLLNQVLVFNYNNGLQSNYNFTLLNISNIFLAKKEYNKALDGYLKILNLSKKEKPINKELVATLYCNIGEVYYSIREYDLSFKYRMESLDLYKEIDLKDGIANLENDIGLSLVKLKNYKQSTEYLAKAREDYETIKYSAGIRNTLENFAILYIETSRYDEALRTCKELEKLSTADKDTIMLAKCTNMYADIYYKTGQYKLSVEYYKKYIELDELVDSRENKQSIAELETAYLTEEKAYENKVLKRENELQKEKLSARGNLLLVISIGVIIAVVLMVMLRIKEKKIRTQNQKLEEHIRSMNKLFSIISHDLRSPFLGFAGMTEMMAADIDSFSRDELLEISSAMNKSVNNLMRMLVNLLDWARIKQGELNYAPKKIGLYKSVSENFELIQKMLEQKGIQFITKIPNELFVYADEEMLNSILRNLFTNAVKFTSNNGEVTVRGTEAENNFVEIKITDNGIGMSETLINKLFRMDEKVGREGTEGEESTGLGLLLCKEFVEKHGGKIWAESKEGTGSTFYFTVPKAS
jgi:signal transduction histidine kinase